MINTKLKALREKADLNNKEISDRSGVPYSTVQKIFNGDTVNPNAESLYQILKAMGYTMEELYEDFPPGGKEEMIAVSTIREMYEHRIADLKEQNQFALSRSEVKNEKHINDLKESHQRHLKTYRTIIGILGVIVGVLFVLFLIYFAMDYANQHWGIFFRE